MEFAKALSKIARGFMGVALWMGLSGCAMFGARGAAPIPRVLNAGLSSPDGQSLYIVASIDGASQVWRINEPLGKLAQLTTGSKAHQIFDMTSDGKFLLLKVEASPEAGLILLPTDGSVGIEVQAGNGVVVNSAFSAGDADRVFYMVYDLRSESSTLYAYEINSMKKEILLQKEGEWTLADVNNDAHMLLSKTTGIRTREIFVWSLGAGEFHPVIGQNSKEGYEIRFARNAGEYLVITKADEEYRGFFILKNGRLEPVNTLGNTDIEGLHVDPRRSRIYISWRENGKWMLEIRDAVNFERFSLKELPTDDSLKVGAASRFGRYVSFLADGAGGEQRVFSYDWKTATLSEWFRSSGAVITPLR